MGKNRGKRKAGRYGKYGENKRIKALRDRKKGPDRARDLRKQEEHFKIAPKHPGRGRS
jgi:hypothetical protein